MGAFKVVGGAFPRGNATVGSDGLNVTTGVLSNELVPYSAILLIDDIDRERRVSTGDRVALGTAGGVIGGLAAGALAGGLTGPAGAVIGAVAGAVIASRRTYMTRRVSLRDGRWFTATAQKDVWATIDDSAQRARSQYLEPPTSSVVSIQNNEHSKSLASARKLWRRLRGAA